MARHGLDSWYDIQEPGMFSVLALQRLLYCYTVWIMAISKSRACLFVFVSCANGAPGLANAEGTLLISGKTGRLKVCLQTFLQL